MSEDSIWRVLHKFFLRTKQCIILSLPFTCFPPRLPRALASSISNFEFRKRGGHSSIYRKRGRRRPNGRKRDAFPIGCCGSVRRKLPEPSRNSQPGQWRSYTLPPGSADLDDFWKNQWKVTVSIIMTPILLCTRPRWSRGLASPLLDINVPIDLTVTETNTGSHEAERTLIKIWWHYWHNVRSNHNYIPNTHKKILIISVIHTRNHVMNFRRYMKEFSFRHQVHAAHIILF